MDLTIVNALMVFVVLDLATPVVATSTNVTREQTNVMFMQLVRILLERMPVNALMVFLEMAAHVKISMSVG